MTLVDQLFGTLSRRVLPEAVAALVLRESNELSSNQRVELSRGNRAGRYSPMSSMPTTFHKSKGMERQLKVATMLMPAMSSLVADGSADNPDAMADVISVGGMIIHKTSNNFKEGRLNRQQRRTVGLGDMSKRQYNKRFRLLTRMSRKNDKLFRNRDKDLMAQLAKSRLACKLTREEFVDHEPSAAFVAYYVANLNRRSTFTVGKQASAYDTIADMLFKRAATVPSQTNWFAIAHVLPDVSTIENLTERQKGQLLGRWHAALVMAAKFLKEIATTTDLNRRTMVVKKGMDSSTWNSAAGCWNKTRDGYLATLRAMQLPNLFEMQCLGKVPRLMAGDVTSWHMTTGDDICHPDVKVWADLPAPWDVLEGKVTCSMTQVEDVCKSHGVDPVKTAWTAPRSEERQAVTWTPTPELVHGVAVSSPELATLLRKAGWFSGKGVKEAFDAAPAAEVVRDEHGFALAARPRVDEPVKSR